MRRTFYGESFSRDDIVKEHLSCVGNKVLEIFFEETSETFSLVLAVRQKRQGMR